MSRRPRLTGTDLIAVLRKAGFEVIRTRGSHYRLRHPDSRCTTVPVHGNETIGPGLIGRILADCELTWDEFLDLLAK